MIVDARPAAASDVPRVAELARGLRDELESLRGGALWLDHEARAEPLEMSLGALLDGDGLLVVGSVDGVVVGYGAVEIATLHSGHRLGRIPELYVEPDARGVSVGESIAAVLVDHCTRIGCVGVDAVVLPGHRAAKNFLETQGFTARQIVAHRALMPGVEP